MLYYRDNNFTLEIVEENHNRNLAGIFNLH